MDHIPRQTFEAISLFTCSVYVLPCLSNRLPSFLIPLAATIVEYEVREVPDDFLIIQSFLPNAVAKIDGFRPSWTWKIKSFVLKRDKNHPHSTMMPRRRRYHRREQSIKYPVVNPALLCAIHDIGGIRTGEPPALPTVPTPLVSVRDAIGDTDQSRTPT